MAQGRWYPSQVLMPDGRTLIAGGLTRPGDPDFVGSKTNNDLELFSPDGAIERQAGFFNGYQDPSLSGLYPRMFWMPSGRALSVGPFATDTWSVAPASPGAPATSSSVPDLSADREWGSAVLSGSRVLALGGSRLDADDPAGADDIRPALSTTEYFDEDAPAAGWQQGPKMAVARSHANSVLLPDGSFVTVGGGSGENAKQEYYRWLFTDSHKRVELFDPSTNTTVLGNAQEEARTYHSTALLLPDGRVMSAGDDINGANGPGTPSGTTSDTAEIYSPPYLFNPAGEPAARPVISGAISSPVRTGDALQVQTSGPTAKSAVLIAPGAATHATDMSQRRIQLAAPTAVPDQPGAIRLVIPSDVDVVPPGYYMLFLLSETGVPSVAKFIRIEAAPDTTAPAVTLTAPAPGSTTDSTPIYSGAAGNLPGDRAATTLRVYAGTTATGTPVQTHTAPRTGASWSVDPWPPLPPDTYTARAEQSDYAGNSGLSSSHTFTIPAPPPPPPPPPPPAPPAPPGNVVPTLKITGALPSLRTLKRKKRFILSVQSSEAATITLEGILERGKKPDRRIAQRPKVTLTAAGKRRITFKLTKAGLKLLAQTRRDVVRIRARAVFRSGAKLPVFQVRRKLR